MSSSQGITNWRERPQKDTENKIPEFRGSPHVYKNRYAPTRDEPYGNQNPRFNEKNPGQQMKQSASLRRQEFLNTSPIRKLEPSQQTVDGNVSGNVQNFVQPFTSQQLANQQQQQFQPRAQTVNYPQFAQQPIPNLQPQFQQRNGNNQNTGSVQQQFWQPQQQVPNLQPQLQQRNGNIQNAGVVPQQLFPSQIRVPNLQPQFPRPDGINQIAAPQPLMQLQIPIPKSLQFQRPKQDNRNQNFKLAQNQQGVDKNPRHQNGHQKSEKQFSGLSESSATKYRDQRIKQMAAMNKNEVPNIPQNQHKQNSRPNKQHQQQPRQQQQNNVRKEQPHRQQMSQPENKIVSAETITKDWIVQPIISNEFLLKKFGTDDPKCQQIQNNSENVSMAFRDKRIQHNANKNRLEDSYKKMNSEQSFSLDKSALPRIAQPEVKYFPRKTFVTFRPKNNSHVLLTSAISMNTIFIRSFKMNHEYCSVVKGYNEMEKSGVPFKKIPEVNGMVLTKYKNICMRAHVTKSFDDHVEVFFTDLGFREKKNLSELMNVNILSHTSVTYIHQYRLKNIPEKSEKSEEVLKYLKSLYERNFELITDDTGKECDLIDYQTNESICSRILNILGIEVPEVVDTKKEIVLKDGGESCDGYIDADLCGPGIGVNNEEDFVDQNQSNSSESLSSIPEKAMNEKNNSAEVSLEKNEENLKNFNEVEKTYEALPNYETSKTEQRHHKKDEDINDLSAITIEKLVISEKEEEISIEYPIEITQEPEHSETKSDLFDENNDTTESSTSKITEGKNVTVVVSDKSELRDGSLSIMNECDYKMLKKLHEEIQTFCAIDDSKSYKPMENEICLAKHSDGKWYRATCLKYISPTKTVVSFIDLGNLSKVSNIDIKKCPRSWTRSCFSVSCFIEDLDEVTPEMETRLNQLIPLDKLIVDEIKYVQVSDDEEICVIELKNVIRILREEGLMF